MSSLKEIAKKKIIDQVLNVTQNGVKIMIVDKESVKIVGSMMKMFEVVAENVTLIENIDLSRKRFDFDALYFLSPSEESIMHLIQDFKDKKNPTYPRIHLFFTEPVPDVLLRKLADSNAYSFVRTFKELYFDFVSFEAQVFHFDMRHSFYQIFSPKSHESEQVLQSFASKLASVCVTLGELPMIRYCASSPMTTVSEKLARYCQTYFESEIGKGHLQFNPTAPRAILLILDRSFDAISPILHEFTYQAMANDLIDIKNGKIFTTKSSTGSESKEMILDEGDPIWMKLRHTHIAEVINDLINDFNKFMTENKAAIKSMGPKAEEHKEVDIKNLAEMKKILAALPQFQELKAKFSAHMNMAQSCMHKFSSDRLAAAAAQEQNLATGLMADGSEVKNVLNDLVPLLTDDSITSNVKARLIMLYFITRKSIDDEEQKKLIHYANLTSEDACAIHNLCLFGLKMTKDKADAKSLKKTKGKFKKHDEDVPYELSRYKPPLKTVIEDACSGTLSNMNFPTLPDPPSIMSLCGGLASARGGYGDSGHGAVATSLRNKPTWQTKKGPEQKTVSGPRVLVFVAGGVTFSEIRAAYEVEQATKRDIVLGGSHVLTPTMFMQDLAQLSKSHFSTPSESTKGGKHGLKLKDKKKH